TGMGRDFGAIGRMESRQREWRKAICCDSTCVDFESRQGEFALLLNDVNSKRRRMKRGFSQGRGRRCGHGAAQNRMLGLSGRGIFRNAQISPGNSKSGPRREICESIPGGEARLRSGFEYGKASA